MSEEEVPATTQDEQVKKKKSVLSKVKLAVIGLIVVLTVIVILQNTDSIKTRILFMDLVMPRAALLILTFLLGAATGVLVAFIRPWKKRHE